MKRIALMALLLLVSLPLFAQSRTDLGAWVIHTELSDEEVADGFPTLQAELEEDLGYGVSLNHFWTGAFSTELTAMRLKADADTIFSSIEGELVPASGTLELTAITAVAQFHFNREGTFSPYLGAGAALLSGEFELDPAIGNVELDTDVSWVANAGVNLRLTDRIAIGADAKYIPWEAKRDGFSFGELALDPVTLSAGVRLRF